MIKKEVLKRRIIVFLILIVPMLVYYLNNLLLTDGIDIAYDDSKEWSYIYTHQQEYPESLFELAKRNKEAIPFVYNYKYQKNVSKNIKEDIKQDSIPLLLQWDERWGYELYGDDYIAVNGCGPTCLSMVAGYLKQDSRLDPYYVSQFAYNNGYLENEGTSWLLMTNGARALGLKAEEISLDRDLIINYLKEGRPIICSMSKGIFTTTGHFIVLREYKDGCIYVNDPNSIERSQKGYTFEQIRSQIKNLWVYDYE